MKPRAHHRELMNWLRRNYPQARNIRLAPGGKHPRLRFTYQDREHSTVVAGSPSDNHALANAKRQLAALLPPKEVQHMPTPTPTVADIWPNKPKPNGADRTPRVLPAATPKPYVPLKPDSIEAHGYVVAYTKRPGSITDLRFIVPTSFHNHLPERMAIKQAGDTWEMTKTTIGPKWSKYDPNNFVLQCGAIALTKGFTAPFAKTPAEYIYTDGTLLVRLTEPPRYRNPEPTATAKETRRAKVLETAKAAVRQTVEETAPPVVDYATELPVLLNAIRRVESTTPYKLKKTPEGEWVFAAPIIKASN